MTNVSADMRAYLWAASVLLMCPALAVGLAGCGANHGTHTAGPTSGPQAVNARQQYAVVYGQEVGTEETVMWRPLPSGDSRVVYHGAKRAAMPGPLWWLPSPDGRRLLVSDTWYERRGQRVTQLQVVSLPGGEATQVAVLRGNEAVLPFWKDSRSLVLETPEGAVTYDVARNALSGAVPQWAPPWPVGISEEESWRPALLAYGEKHYADQIDAVRRAVTELRGRLDLSDSLRGYQIGHFQIAGDPVEYFFLRSLSFVPTLGPGRVMNPTVVCAPDGRVAAVAHLTKTAVKWLDGTGQWLPSRLVTAHVGVFDLGARQRLWETSVDWGAVAEPGLASLPGPGTEEWRTPESYSAEARQPHFRDLRWSTDGRYLSFTGYGLPPLPGLPRPGYHQNPLRARVLASEATLGDWSTAVFIVDPSLWEQRSPPPGQDWNCLYIASARDAFIVPASR